MRTISAIALCLMLVFATTGCAASKIAVVDPARLFQESEPGKAGIEHLKQLEAAMQEQLKTAQGMIEKAPNDEALRARFQKTFVGYQQIVNAEQQKVVQQINGLMQKTLEDFRTKNGYSVIMNAEGLLAFDPKSDVTKEVIAEMDKTKVTFAPVKLEPITAARRPTTRPLRRLTPATDQSKWQRTWEETASEGYFSPGLLSQGFRLVGGCVPAFLPEHKAHSDVTEWAFTIGMHWAKASCLGTAHCFWRSPTAQALRDSNRPKVLGRERRARIGMSRGRDVCFRKVCLFPPQRFSSFPAQT